MPYIVVKGLPIECGESFSDAHRYAIEQAEETREDHTILMVSQEALDIAVVAQYEGVVLRYLQAVTDSLL